MAVTVPAHRCCESLYRRRARVHVI